MERSRGHYVVRGVVVEKLYTRIGATKSVLKPDGHSSKFLAAFKLLQASHSVQVK